MGFTFSKLRTARNLLGRFVEELSRYRKIWKSARYRSFAIRKFISLKITRIVNMQIFPISKNTSLICVIRFVIGTASDKCYMTDTEKI